MPSPVNWRTARRAAANLVRRQLCCLRADPIAHKHSGVRRTRSALRDLFAMFCIAVALLFAGASAASVIDGAQHAAKAPHEHHFSLTAMADDHHDSADDHGDHHADHEPDDQSGDLQTGPGHHHHSEPPAGPPTLIATRLPVALGDALVRAERAAAAVEGVIPGGLRRPPRSLAILS